MKTECKFKIYKSSTFYESPKVFYKLQYHILKRSGIAMVGNSLNNVADEILKMSKGASKAAGLQSLLSIKEFEELQKIIEKKKSKGGNYPQFIYEKST